MNTTNNEEELKKIIARREGKMYGYYKATFDDDFTGGYPVEYDKELIDFCSSVRRETLEATRKIVTEYRDFAVKQKEECLLNDLVMLAYDMDSRLVATKHILEKFTNLDTISHE